MLAGLLRNPALRVVLAALPFAALIPVLRLVPNAATNFQPMPWSHAAGHALVLFGMMAAHAACYARWSVGAPRLIVQNEAFTRLWFVLFGFLIVAGHKPTGLLYACLALPWAALSFLTHLRFAARDGRYRFTTNLGLLGLFLFGLALIGLIGIRAA